MKYKIVDENYSFDLEVEVTKLLNQGWKLAGGVSISTFYSVMRFTQALVKEDE